SAHAGTGQSLARTRTAILTASAIGIDYGAGTLRSVLTQGVGRWPYLTAKIITLAVIAFFGLVAALATVAMSSLIAAAIAGAPPEGATTATWSDAGLALWKAWSSTLPYLGLHTFVSVVAGSSVAGLT